MSSVNSVAYTSLASSEAIRHLAPQLPGQEEIVAAQLKASMQADPGSTITARYQFKVAPDGSLTPTETQITTEANTAESASDNQPNNRRSGNFLRQQARGRNPSFADFSPTRPQLSPSDEITLFGNKTTNAAALPLTDAETDPQVAQTVASAVLHGEASQADGTPIEAEILPPAGHAANDNGLATPPSLAARAQSAVAGLYARNNDIVYNVTPISELAA